MINRLTGMPQVGVISPLPANIFMLAATKDGKILFGEIPKHANPKTILYNRSNCSQDATHNSRHHQLLRKVLGRANALYLELIQCTID
jgi:hypothetical protein